MSWTSLEIVRKHLQETAAAATAFEDEEHVLAGTAQEQLEHTSITLNSETVKSIDLGSPYSVGSLSLTGTSWRKLPHENLVPNSVVAAGDQQLNTVYVEGTDYVILYGEGRIKRVAGSAIPDGGTVYVWYFYYTAHTRDVDYQIDYDSGKLNRIEGGGIADGATVFVDYSTAAGTVADNLILEAITEAEDKILARLKDEYNASSADQGLTTGATELALAIVCNGKAMDMMLKVPSDDVDGAAGQWRAMSQRFEAQAWATLDRFLKARSRRGPSAVRNGSWEIWD